MALDFPNNPVNGQTYDNFIYDAAKGTWRSLSSGASPNFLVNPTITNAVITATATTPSTVPITVNGAASQTANLQDWKNSAGIVLADVDNLGNLQAPKLGLGGAVPPISPSSTNLQVNGRAKILSNGSESAGIWLTGSNNVDTAFIGQFSPTTTDPVGIFHNGAWRFSVDSLGRVFMPNQPSFMAFRTTSTNVNNVVVYNSTQHNSGGHYNTSTGRFTTPVAGRYAFSINSIGNVSGSTIRLTVRLNGSRTTIASDFQLRIPVAANYNQGSLNFVWNLAANDFVDVLVTEGTEYSDGSAYSNWSGYLLG